MHGESIQKYQALFPVVTPLDPSDFKSVLFPYAMVNLLREGNSLPKPMPAKSLVQVMVQVNPK